MKVHIHIDGGSRGNPGPGASAYVIKDMAGKIVAQEGHFLPHCTNNQAEYTALKLALVKSAELGAQELDVISDSLLLVKQYLGEYKIKHPDLAARMLEIRALAAPFKKIKIQHVLRHLNKEPDALANKAMDLKQSIGYNPILKMPSDAHLAQKNAIKEEKDTVNGVRVKPVKRADSPQTSTLKTAPALAQKKTKKPAHPAQLDLFGEPL